ncbi:MAG: ABC transporter ATP-binding protein/permease [Lachnospiraceae bacterium]|nr:ABC transporter ATP-binding protein/permease [Lachnospiraceae bacterium]
MKKLLRFLKDYKKECVLAPLFKMLEASFELFVPLVMAAIIDKGIARSDEPYIVKMSLIVISLGLIGLVCSITAQYFSAKAAVGFATKVRHSLFRHIESLDYSTLDKLGTSTLITRMTSDINQAQSGVNMVLRLFLRSPFIVLGAMVMAFTVNVGAAMTFVVTIPLLSLVVFGVMGLSIPLYKKVQLGLDKVLNRTRENLTGVRVIRAFAMEDQEIEHFNKENAELTGMSMHVGRISALMNPITYVIINLATVYLIYIGALKVDVGTLSQGDVVALVNYMSQILVELIKFANFIVTVNKALASGNRIQSIFDVKPAFSRADISGDKSLDGHLIFDDKSGDYAIEFNKAGLAYIEGGDEALSNIDFKVKKGETVGIIGGTGSGKSSIVNLIPRFYDATAGEVKVFGANVKDYVLDSLRQVIGDVPQKAVLFKGSIADNLRWGNSNATDEDLYKALDIAQAREFVDQKEGGLSFMLEQGGRNLSGGQRQRLTIARALVRQPKILILDDSSSALDFATDLKLRTALKDMGGDMTTVIVSQRTSSIKHADKIVVMDDGEIAGMGTHEELLKSCEIYKEIHESQFKGVE